MSKKIDAMLVNNLPGNPLKMENLGKINVICGKNSSGKTSILKSIQGNNLPSVGKRISSDDIIALKNQWQTYANKSVAFIDNYPYQNQSYGIRDVFSSFVNTPEVIERLTSIEDYFYKEDYLKIGNYFLNLALKMKFETTNPLSELVFKKFEDAETKREIVNKISITLANPLLQKLENQTEITSLYISPKRKVSTTSGTITHQNVDGEGSGLMEKIFHMKSSLSNSFERKRYEKFFKAFSDVTENFRFDVIMETQPQVTLRLYFSPIAEDRWVSAESAGLGLQDLLVIIYLALESTNDFILIEEPENHLHPYMQRRLLQFLKEKTSDDKQFIISTHSNVFLDSTYVDRIFLSKYENNTIQLSDASTKSEILTDIGYSVLDNLVSDLIIMVEGSADKIAIKHFLTELEIIPKYKISIWVLSGDTMNSLDLSSFAENYKMIALLDRDDKSDREIFRAECKKYKVPVVDLKRYSLENYIPLSVYRESFPNIPSKITEFDNDAPIWEQLGRIPKKDIKKGVKSFVLKMSLKDLNGTDLMDFLNRIKNTFTKK